MGKNYRKVTEFKTVEDFAEYVKSEGFHIGFAPDAKTEALSQSIECMGMTIGNRWAVLPMEGWDCHFSGEPSLLTYRRWMRFAASGAKLIYGTEAGAVMHSGRSNPHQLLVNDFTLPALRSFVSEMRHVHREKFGRDDDLCIGLQLTHSGRYSHPNDAAKREAVTAYAHPLLDKKFGNDASNVVSDEELENIVKHFIKAARIAGDAGFDFVDIKHAHGYLAHEMLTAYDRPGKYGGSFENRTRFSREIIEGIKKEVPNIKISVRLSLFDIIPFIKGEDGLGKPMQWDADKPYPYAFGGDGTGLGMDPDLKDTSIFIDMLKNYGVDLICCTIGSPYYSVHIQRPAYYPVCDGYDIPEHPLYNVGRHLEAVKRIKELHPDVRFIASGLSCLQEYMPNAAEYAIENNWADFAGIGRMALSYPAICTDVLEHRPLQKKCICRTLGDCTNAPRNGMVSGCYPLDGYFAGLKNLFKSGGCFSVNYENDKYLDPYFPEDFFMNFSDGKFNRNIYPVFSDRAAWEKVRHQEFAQRIIDAAESALQEAVPQLLMSEYRRFAEDGDRVGYELLYFKRRENLAYFALAACLTGDIEKYIGRLLDYVQAVMEEGRWTVPAHAQWDKNVLIDNAPSDLFCCETGAVMSVLYHILGEELNKKNRNIAERLRKMILDRTVYNVIYNKDSLFMHHWFVGELPRNWTPWCAYNCLICAVLLEKDNKKLAEIVRIFLAIISRSIAVFNDDGYCDEGPTYYNKSVLMVFGALQLMDKIQPGSMEKVFALPKIKNMLEFFGHIQIAPGQVFSFADAQVSFAPHMHLLIPAAAAVRSEFLQRICKSYNSLLGMCGDYLLTGVGMLFDIRDTQQVSNAQYQPLSYYADKVAVFRNQRFAVGSKGGCNFESHNHNDLGQFIIYHDNKPIIVDAGTGLYSRENFGQNRYKLWYTRGMGHNAPVLGDFEQMAGRYFARFAEISETGTVIDLHEAYPQEAGVEKFLRTIRVAEDEVSVSDDIALKQALPVSITLITPEEVQVIDKTRLQIGDIMLQCENIYYESCEKKEDLKIRQGNYFLWGIELKLLHFKTDDLNYKFIFRRDNK